MTHSLQPSDAQANRRLYQAAVELGIASTPTEFWTLVRRSGMTAEHIVARAEAQLEQKPRWVSRDADDATQCPFCLSRWGHHHPGCPDE